MNVNFIKCIRLSSFGFQVQVPQVNQEQQVHYIFDTKVETPVKKCEEKPYLGLVSQVDKVLVPSRDCYNPEHTPDTCDCASNDYKLPIQYNSRYETVLKNNPQYSIDPVDQAMSTIKRKREVTDDKLVKSKLRSRIAKKLKAQKARSAKRKLVTKELPAPLLKTSPFLKPKSKRNPKSKNLKFSNPEYSDPQFLIPQFSPSQFSQYSSRPKRGPSNSSPCGYTYESCDVAKHNKEGCPLCYKCKCEPVHGHDPTLKFQPNDIKIPYKFVTSNDNTPSEAAHFQEFDHEAKSYTGLKKPDQYNDYIQHVLTKYPEHLARNMPDMKGQQADLMKFIDELAKNKVKPGVRSKEEEDKYKFIDNAMDFYKFYQNSLAKPLPVMPANQFEPKPFQKRGTVLEVIDLNPDNFESYEGDIRDDSHYTYN